MLYRSTTRPILAHFTDSHSDSLTHSSKLQKSLQCKEWKKTCKGFSTSLILREINFGWLQKVKNSHFNNFRGFEFWFLLKVHIWKCQKFPKIQKRIYSNWKMVKMSVLGASKRPNLISRKILSGRKILKFPHYWGG